MFMDSLDTAGCFVDDLLDFALDICEDDDDEDLTTRKPSKPFSSLDPPPFHPLPEFAEEDLEWMLNKDAFPAVETFLGVGTLSTHHSPVSVLENSSNSTGSGGSSSGGGIIIMNYCGSMRVPVKARSKCLKRRRRDITAQQCWWSQENLKSAKPAAATIGRKCQHCGSEKTPQWRAGPLGPKTLCNACGVRYKSGRLVPEYRPASSPTFCSELHSNSHRKVLDMRRQKQMMGLVVAKPLEKG